MGSKRVKHDCMTNCFTFHFHGYKTRLKMNKTYPIYNLTQPVPNPCSVVFLRLNSLKLKAVNCWAPHTICCAIYYDTSYLLVCNWIFKMQSESPFICSFIRHSLNALDAQWCKSQHLPTWVLMFCLLPLTFRVSWCSCFCVCVYVCLQCQNSYFCQGLAGHSLK